jgi:hypothetical protein
MTLDPRKMLVPTESGHWVSNEFAQIAEIINDYDEHLRLVWIPPEHRTDNTPPYAIVETNGVGEEKVVFTIKEEELNHSVLTRLFRGDTHKNDVLANIEADDIARKALELKDQLEKSEERKDFIAAVAKSPLHSFKHNGRIIPC